MRVFTIQQTASFRHQTRMMFTKTHASRLLIILLFALLISGCIKLTDKVERAKLLKTENAGQADLEKEVNRLAQINSMRAKMDLKFEDNSYAEIGLAEKYKTADGEVVIQRPANILLKVQIPIIKSDVAQMTSDGEKFRVAVLQDGGSGKYKKFVVGSNNADYSALQENLNAMDLDDAKAIKQNVNAFANLRPQHFTDAMLIRPIDTTKNFYVQSTILEDEQDLSVQKKSPLRRVLRGYYLLDELHKNDDGSLSVMRRFWFDRVGGIRLARQQIFDSKGEIESDITYGNTGNLSESSDYANLPLRIEVTRPKEKYKMSLTYQSPASVSIGKNYPATAFVLENSWGLEEVNLDEKLVQAKGRKGDTVMRQPEAKVQAQ